MPRTVEEILAHADSLAAGFEAHEPTAQAKSTTTLKALRNAVLRRAEAERLVLACVIDARHNDVSWSAIGTMMGTTGEAARQRYAGAVANAQQSRDNGERQRALEILAAAGVTPDDMEEFATLLQFTATLGEAGHVGPAGSLQWSEDKARAMGQAIPLLASAAGIDVVWPPQSASADPAGVAEDS